MAPIQAVENQFPIGIEFNLDDINDPVFGTATNLKGWFPFVLPPGVYKYPSILNEPKRFKKVINELVPICRDLYQELLDEDIFKLVSQYATFASLCHCSELDKNVDKASVLAVVMAFKLDDIVDNAFCVSSSNMDDDCKNIVGLTYKQIMMTVDDIQNKQDIQFSLDNFPSIHPMISCLKKVAAKLIEYVSSEMPGLESNLQTNNGIGMQEVIISSQATIVDAEMNKQGLNYSTTTKFEFYRYLNGMRTMLNTSATLHNIQLSCQIKSDILFQSTLNNYSDITVFANAIFGLPRDIINGGEDGPIVYLVTIKKWPLQKAYEEIYERLQGALSDFIINSKKLMEVYNENEDLMKYVEIMGKSIDGHFYVYKTMARYGVQDKIKVLYKILQE